MKLYTVSPICVLSETDRYATSGVMVGMCGLGLVVKLTAKLKVPIKRFNFLVYHVQCYYR